MTEERNGNSMRTSQLNLTSGMVKEKAESSLWFDFFYYYSQNQVFLHSFCAFKDNTGSGIYPSGQTQLGNIHIYFEEPGFESPLYSQFQLSTAVRSARQQVTLQRVGSLSLIRGTRVCISYSVGIRGVSQWIGARHLYSLFSKNKSKHKVLQNKNQV